MPLLYVLLTIYNGIRMKIIIVLFYSISCFAQIPTNFPAYNITIDSNATPGQIFFAPFYNGNGTDNPPFLAIMNNDGSLLQSKQLANEGFGFTIQPTGYYTYYDLNSGYFIVLDSNFNQVSYYSAQNGYQTDLHELRLLPNGNAILLGMDVKSVDMSKIISGGNPDAQVVGCILQELDPSNKVVFEWRSWDHFQITDATQDINLLDTLIDYVHANSVDIDTDGNFLLSSRHLDEVTKINSRTGDIIWRFGGKNNQFTFLNDSIGFSHQHHVRRIANGDITMFDNGNLHNPPFSRAVEYKLDEVNKTASLVWEYKNNPVSFSLAMGSVQRLDNGNTLIGWGSNYSNDVSITEVTYTGQKVFEINIPNTWSYRALKFNIYPTSVRQYPMTAENYRINQNYPNPFNPQTVINYSIPFLSDIHLIIYNTLGEKVKELFAGTKQPGNYSVSFNGTGLSSGVYFYSFSAQTIDGKQSFHSVKKMLLLK